MSFGPSLFRLSPFWMELSHNLITVVVQTFDSGSIQHQSDSRKNKANTMGKNEAGTSLCYIKDAEYAWVPATLTKTEGDKAYVQVPQYKDEQSIMSDGGRAAKGAPVEKVINLKDYAHKVLPLQNVDKNGCLTEHADMVQLPYLHEVCNPLDCYACAKTLYSHHKLKQQITCSLC